MTTQTERDLRLRLKDAEIRLALADLPHIPPAARYDLARRLIELNAEVRPDGSVRLESGGDLTDALALIKADGGSHLFSDTAPAAAKAKPDLSSLTAAQKLSACNGGDL